MHEDVEVLARSGAEPEVDDLVEAGVGQREARFRLVEAGERPGGFIDGATGVVVDAPFDGIELWSNSTKKSTVWSYSVQMPCPSGRTVGR